MTFESQTIGDCTLYLGDCLDVLPTLGEVDAVVTDPPYGVMLGEVSNGQANAKHQQPYTMFSDTPEFVQDVVVPAIELCRSKSKRVAVTSGNRNMWTYPQPDDMGVWWNPAGTSSGRWGFNCMVTPILYYGSDPKIHKGRTPSSPASVVSDRQPKPDHPCPKPIRFMEWLVNKASLDDELILDPFMGSGTTGVACVNLGRKFIGIEIERRYFDIACERIEAANNQRRLF